MSEHQNPNRHPGLYFAKSRHQTLLQFQDLQGQALASPDLPVTKGTSIFTRNTAKRVADLRGHSNLISNFDIPCSTFDIL